MGDFKKRYYSEIVKNLKEKLHLKNSMAVPKLVKIVVNTSNREFLSDKKTLERVKEELLAITGQAPKISKAKVSVATFKLREGDDIGLSVTLRRDRMYDFFEKLVKIVFPRVKDFNGVDVSSLDGRGNITIGFSEHTVFPEIDMGKVDKIRGLQVVIVTSSRNKEEGKLLLEEMGMPFKKIKN